MEFDPFSTWFGIVSLNVGLASVQSEDRLLHLRDIRVLDPLLTWFGIVPSKVAWVCCSQQHQAGTDSSTGGTSGYWTPSYRLGSANIARLGRGQRGLSKHLKKDDRSCSPAGSGRRQ
jgi:hypothetical protein